MRDLGALARESSVKVFTDEMVDRSVLRLRLRFLTEDNPPSFAEAMAVSAFAFAAAEAIEFDVQVSMVSAAGAGYFDWRNGLTRTPSWAATFRAVWLRLRLVL